MSDISLLQQIKEASFHLLNHEVVSFPTETVMGLGVLYNDFDAYELLNKIKRRPEDKPYTLMCGSIEELNKYGVIDSRIRKIVDAFMPGSITIIVKKRDVVPDYVSHKSDTVGLRVPSNEEALLLLNHINVPLLVPSANKAGEKPCLNSNEVKEVFNDEVACVIDGEAKLEKASTIVDLTKEKPIILRKGPISEDDIMKVWNE